MQKYCRAICLSWMMLLACISSVYAQDKAVRGRALIVGVNDYKDEGINDLKYSVADAHLLADKLKDGQSSLFTPENVRVLADDTENKPTRQAILKGIEWLSEAAPDETVLLYFSGHGTVDKRDQYLVSSDTEVAAIPDTAVSIGRINSILDDPQRTKARRVVVIFDACHSGVRRGAKALGTEALEKDSIVESLMTDAEGRVTLSSCNADEQSFEDPTTKHGVFTYYLVEGLKGAADTNNDSLISVGELHVYTRRAVTDWAVRSGRQQTPRVQMNVSGEILLTKDAVKLRALQSQGRERVIKLQRLRTDLQARIGAGGLSPVTGATLLASLDRLLDGSGGASDFRREDLTTQFVDNQIAAATLSAELQAMKVPEDDACRDEETSGFGVQILKTSTEKSEIKVQLFQPLAQEVQDGFVIQCQAGEKLKLVGLAQSTAGVTRVLLNCRELSAGSIDARDLQLVKTPAPADMKFEGSITAGNAPSTFKLVIYDAAGNRRVIRLQLQPAAATPIVNSGKPVVAVIGLNKKAEIDTYDDLKPLRVGMGLTEQLIDAARNSNRCTLVNGDSDVLKSIIEMQWQQQEAAFDRSRAVRTGRLVGARFVLYGVVYYFALPSENDGELALKIQLKMVDVETGMLYPASGQASLGNPNKQAGGREFSKKNLDDVATKAMNQALTDLWDYLIKQGVLAKPLPENPALQAAVPNRDEGLQLALREPSL